MSITDFIILAKKVAIGLIIGIIPLVLIAGGLWLTRALLNDKPARQVSTK